ncbi:hypothetical protein EDD21DRAFT_408802 [Dissophora ornata]|nr:hypothetical protein EDD21DRAFT_408802 [Dissophora ornata]
MPVADSQSDRDCKTLPCPVYSGHLLKLGSNDRWQSRLFTFDGSVLVCVGKKPKAPVIVTYDPHVSSPFMLPSCSPHPLNPNTEWFIAISSVTDIKLLSIPRSHHCFFHSDTSKELTIQTTDGRSILLRASKDTELERWYFILSTIWEYQQQLSKADSTGSPHTSGHLAAHQRSAQLFQKYLQTQYPDSQDDQQRQLSQRPSSPHLRLPPQIMTRDSFAQFQIPPPARISAFLPQGFDWSQQEQGDEGDIPARFIASFHELQSAPGERERRSLEQQSIWSHSHHYQAQVSTSMATGRHHSGDLIHSSSAVLVHQSLGYHAANSMEPGKAAIIDSWRRSLIMPMFTEEPISMRSGDNGFQETRGGPGVTASIDNIRQRNSRGSTSDLAGPRQDSRDMESTLKHSSLNLDSGINGTENDLKVGDQDLSTGFAKWCIQKEFDNDDDTPVSDNNPYLRGFGRRRNFKGNKRSSNLPGLDILPKNKDDDTASLYNRDDTVQDLNIGYAVRPNFVSKEEDDTPLGLIQVNRLSRWLNTQLSSEDGASCTRRESHTNSAEATHRLLPSGTITPEQTPAKLASICHEIHTGRDSFDIHGHARSLSNPSLSLHGSSYMHLPIHDPDFVFPKQIQNASTAANNQPVHVTQTKTSVTEATNFTALFVHTPIRRQRRGQGGNILSTPKSSTNAATKFMTIDTSPYTNIKFSNSNHPIPPSRPLRPPEVTLSPLLTESEGALPSMVYFDHQSSNAPPPPSPTTYRSRRNEEKPSLSRSVSIRSSVSQVHPHGQSPMPHHVSPYQPNGSIAHGKAHDDEDEPLGVTLSRQQSRRQQKQHTTASSAILKRNSSSQTDNNRSEGVTASRTYGQAALGASSASFSYFKKNPLRSRLKRKSEG